MRPKKGVHGGVKHPHAPLFFRHLASGGFSRRQRKHLQLSNYKYFKNSVFLRGISVNLRATKNSAPTQFVEIG